VRAGRHLRCTGPGLLGSGGSGSRDFYIILWSRFSSRTRVCVYTFMAQLPFFIYYKLHIKNYMLHNYYVVTRQHNRTHACKVASPEPFAAGQVHARHDVMTRTTRAHNKMQINNPDTHAYEGTKLVYDGMQR